MNTVIKLVNAPIIQQENTILDSVNLTIYQGDFVYIIGKVGSGKSSLLKTLYNELPLIGGEGYIAGYNLLNIKSKHVPHLRRKLGVVFQDFQLMHDRTVYANLRFVLKSTGWKHEHAIKDRIREVLSIVNLGSVADVMPHRLSGGEQQRVVIARAILNNPEIILADEATGNLDPEASESLMSVLLEINKEGKTILFATHDYPLIRKFPARKLICEDGALKEIGEKEEVIDGNIAGVG